MNEKTLKYRFIGLKIIFAYVGVIYLFLFVVKTMEHLADGMLLSANISPVTLLLFFLNYVVSTIPALLLGSAVIYFYIRPIILYDRKFQIGDSKFSGEELGIVRKRIYNFPNLVFILNTATFVLGLIVDLTVNQREMIENPFSPMTSTYVLFTLFSASFYSFSTITLYNQLIERIRQSHNMTSISEFEEHKEGSFRRRTVLLLTSAAGYALTFILHNFFKYLRILDGGGENPSSRAFFLLIGVILLGIVILIAVLFTREQSNRIRLQTHYIDRILIGEESLEKRIPILQKDEIGYSTDKINRLMDKLFSIVSKIDESTHQIESNSFNLDGHLADSATALKQLSSSIGLISGSMVDQTRTVDQTSEKIMGILEGIAKIDHDIYEQMSFVEQTSSSMTEMASNINSVSQSTEKVKELALTLQDEIESGAVSVSNAKDSIKNIDEASNEVIGVVDILINISSQTNLLAMNAAIEAAHAGAHGKGFAVVASEIRKLAENSAEETNKITNIIKKMEERINSGVGASKQTELSFVNIKTGIENITDLLREVSEAMIEQNLGVSQIVNSVESVVTATDEVRSITNELKVESEVIRDDVGNLREISHSINSTTEQQNEGAQSALQLSEKIQTLSNHNTETISELAHQIAGFQRKDREHD